MNVATIRTTADERFHVTRHAKSRVDGRRLGFNAVEAALTYGREIHIRRAVYYVIGRKEISRYAKRGIELRRYEGVHVVCTPENEILTSYRNRSLRGLRPRRRHRW